MTTLTLPIARSLREMIADFHAEKLEPGVLRDVTLPSLPRKATVCIGVRRCGKSTLLKQTIQELEQQGMLRTSMVHLNFFDNRLSALKETGFEPVLDAYFSLQPEKHGTPLLFFFDEIQQIQGWEGFVERLLREGNNKVFITGSSADMLSREIATQMRGRAISQELFPFSFGEFLLFRGISKEDPTVKGRHRIRKAFDDYWARGGFPEVRNLERHFRVQIHQEYVRTLLLRDVVERHNLPNPQGVLSLGYRLMDSAASLYSVNRLAEHLKARHLGMSKEMVQNCLHWFEDAYFLFSVPLYDASEHRRHINPRKSYCIDHAMIRSVSAGFRRDEGHLLENLVFIHLRRRTNRIFYHRTKSGAETDFIVMDAEGKRRLVQVCLTLADIGTRDREINALRETMSELHEKQGTLVTLDEEGVIKEKGLRIDCMPVWRFLLM